MPENKIKRALAEGRAVLNGWLTIPDGFATETMAQCGYDTLTVDLQHGVQDYMSMIRCFQAMGKYPPLPMVRVPWNEPGIIGKVLDGGAYGVICPMVNTEEEARAFVAACLYPPRGFRSNGPTRISGYGADSPYQKTANDEILVIAMIETREAVANLEAILDVPGLTGVYIGPSDLAFSHGLAPFLDREEPEMLAIFDRVIAACNRRGLAPGLHCLKADYALGAVKRGFRFVTVGHDSTWIEQGAKAALKSVRESIP
jgi:4-hydroxy-2-oxoheptanedioate aldolase